VWTLTARWIFPVGGPPLERGTVTINADRIVAVEPRGARPADVDLGEAAALPGLVNAHTHLDLSGLRGLAPPSPDFTGWLRQVIAHRRTATPERTQADIRAGVAEALACGTTLLGDVAASGASWHALTEAPLRAVVFHELLGLPPERASTAWQHLCYWLSVFPTRPTWRTGISPHAPYSVHASLFRPAVWQGVPVAIHLAESAAELELLAHRRGPFVEFLRELDVWAPEGLVESPDQILTLTRGLNPVLYVHANYLSPDAPVPPNGAVVYCPRTHAAFGHPPHPFREFLARGARIAVGTDSLASNPDLDVLAEIRFLHRQYPEMPGARLLRMATLSGAEALGWHDETGSLTAGKSADLAVVPLTPDAAGADPHEALLGGSEPVRDVLFRGRWVRGRRAVP
jgi:cytosine/adenosine deaminase-related metal-dependent hydrolase